jgi:hypothetical protein
VSDSIVVGNDVLLGISMVNALDDDATNGGSCQDTTVTDVSWGTSGWRSRMSLNCLWNREVIERPTWRYRRR